MKHAARGVLAVLTLLAVATAMIWQWQPDLVDRFGDYVTDRRTNECQTRLNRARRQLRDGDDAGRRALTKLIDELDAVRHGDRLYPVKREGAKVLAGYLADQGDWKSAAKLSERWVAWDDHDITARLSLAQACLQIAERAAEGRAELAELFKMAPESDEVASAYVSCLIADDKPADALLAIQEFLSSQRSRFAGQCSFSLMSPGKLESLNASPFQDEDGRWRWTVEPETDPEKMMIRLPQFEIAAIDDPRLAIWDIEADDHIDLPQRDAELSDSIRRDGTNWTLQGTDPDEPLTTSDAFVLYSMPAALRGKRIMIGLIGHVVPRYPLWIAEAFGSPLFTPDRVASAASRQDRPNLLDEFHSLRTDVLKQSRLGLSSLGTDDFEWTAMGGVTQKGRIHFDLGLPVGRSTPDLQLQLPAVADAVYDFSQIEVGEGETVVEVDPQSLEVVGGLDNTQGGLRVTGSRAIVLIPLPGNLATLGSVRLVGTVQ